MADRHGQRPEKNDQRQHDLGPNPPDRELDHAVIVEGRMAPPQVGKFVDALTRWLRNNGYSQT